MGGRPLLHFHLTNTTIIPCQVSSMTLARHILQTATPCMLRRLQMGGLQVIHTDLNNLRELQNQICFFFSIQLARIQGLGFLRDRSKLGEIMNRVRRKTADDHRTLSTC
jgi:hypothetical protein